MFVLLYPIIVVLFACIAIITYIKKSKKISLVCIILCLIVNWISQSYALHPITCKFYSDKEDGRLRVLTYNVWCGSPFMRQHDNDNADELVNSISRLDVDVLVLNEIYYSRFNNIVDTLAKLFPYNTHALKPLNNTSTQVFSNYPINNLHNIEYMADCGMASNTETWVMELDTPNGGIFVAACYMTSNKVSKSLSNADANIKDFDGKNIVNSIKLGYHIRQLEAESLRSVMNSNNMPKIALGDFNDIGGSYAVRYSMGDDLVDAWWKGGFGFGFTYDMHRLLLRLDHILYSKNDFELKGVKVLKDWKYSDHYPIVADFSMP